MHVNDQNQATPGPVNVGQFATPVSSDGVQKVRVSGIPKKTAAQIPGHVKFGPTGFYIYLPSHLLMRMKKK